MHGKLLRTLPLILTYLPLLTAIPPLLAAFWNRVQAPLLLRLHVTLSSFRGVLGAGTSKKFTTRLRTHLESKRCILGSVGMLALR